MNSLEITKNAIKSKNVMIEIYGLGYVGFPLAVRLSISGFNVIGIDVNNNRIERLEKNKLMDSEIYLQDDYFKVREQKKLEFRNAPETYKIPKIGIICVPTPIPDENTNSDIYVKKAVESFLNKSKTNDIIILESSIEVGTTERIRKIITNHGYKVGENFGLCFCPERIDPANKEWGIENIPRVIYCSDNNSFEISREIYQHVNNGNLLRVSSPKIAEIVKSFENAFRLVNISLVNELAILCDKLKINVKEIIDAASTKPFGFMAHYPGAGAGGHCIPKDPRFLLESAKLNGINFITIENALKINDIMPKYISEQIEQKISELDVEKSVLVCGLSYKANVEDMRDSPSFKIIKELTRKGMKVYGYDPFFKTYLLEKYLIENHMSELNLEVLSELNQQEVKKISCICIVQHHEITKEIIDDIYKKSVVPLIFDCQNKIKKIENSKTNLEYLGN